MDKLDLALDDLEVDSFQANPEQDGERGTVQGNDHSCHSCELTCDYTCDDYTCWDNCTIRPCIR